MVNGAEHGHTIIRFERPAPKKIKRLQSILKIPSAAAYHGSSAAP
jgi:hypothetical protein